MATKLRLQRRGRKNYAFYQIIVADSRAPRDGKYIERIGSYNPNTHPATITLDFDRALYWLQVGAQPTDTVRNILSNEGVLMMKHLLGGVKKGSFDQAEAEKRFEAWKNSKQQTAQSLKNKDDEKKRAEEKARLEAEKEANKAKAAAVAKKNAVEAPVTEEAPEVEEEVVVVEEVAPEAVVEETAPEATVEEVAPEVAEEITEVVEEVAPEVVAEEVAPEATEEAPEVTEEAAPETEEAKPE